MINKLRYFEFNENEASRKVGEIFADSIRKSVENITTLPEGFYEMKQKLINTFPKYYKEVCGRAEGACVDVDKYLLSVSYELYESKNEKCTDVIIKKSNGQVLYGHNEDGPYTLDNSAIIKYITDKGWYTEYTSIDSLAGTTYLWNSNGIIFSGNYIHTEHKELQEISTWFILRNIVECTSVEEIIKGIKAVKSASGFNINVIDTKVNKVYSIEFYLDKIDVIEITNKFVHTNHFIHLDGKDGYFPEDSNTKNRLKKATELLDKLDMSNSNILDIKDILEYDNSDYMNSIHFALGSNKSITGSAFLFDSESKYIQICDYIGNTKMNFTYYYNSEQ